MLFSRDPRSRRRAELVGACANLLLGGLCLGGGLSGKLVFLGLAAWPFTAIGCVLVAVGGLRLWRWFGRRGEAAGGAGQGDGGE